MVLDAAREDLRTVDFGRRHAGDRPFFAAAVPDELFHTPGGVVSRFGGQVVLRDEAMALRQRDRVRVDLLDLLEAYSLEADQAQADAEKHLAGNRQVARREE